MRYFLDVPKRDTKPVGVCVWCVFVCVWGVFVCVCVCVCVYRCMYVVWVGGSGLIGWVTGRRRDVQCSSDKFRHQKADYAYAILILFLGHGLASMTSPPLIPLQYSPDPSAASPVTLPQVGIRTLLELYESYETGGCINTCLITAMK